MLSTWETFARKRVERGIEIRRRTRCESGGVRSGRSRQSAIAELEKRIILSLRESEAKTSGVPYVGDVSPRDGMTRVVRKVLKKAAERVEKSVMRSQNVLLSLRNRSET